MGPTCNVWPCVSLSDAFYSLLVVRTPSSLFTFLFACFLKIYPRVTGFKLFEELVNCLSVLLTAINFLAASVVAAIAKLSTSSGAEQFISLIFDNCFLLSSTGTELVESSYFESTRIKMWSKLSRSSFDEFVFMADSWTCLTRLRRAESIFFLVLSMLFTFAEPV